MTGYVVIVDFRLYPGMGTAFRRLVDANARISAGTEPSCRRFDVVEPHEDRDRVLLVEVYDDEAGFDAHVRSDHYKHFDTESAPLVSAKSVLRGELVFEGRSAAQT
ncbi:putative quinol monooxygenase [Microvirga sp. TS319]|uniref:putative quinol monooxygenase n=1 Tax=Microvirga sp. TS319 TaxID=3241165 RepID=UPI00351AA03A